MNYSALNKAQADLSSLKQIQPFGGNRRFTQSISFNKAKAVQAGPLFTLIETASNKSNHLAAKGVKTEHIA